MFMISVSFFFVFGPVACGILVPWPGMESRPGSEDRCLHWEDTQTLVSSDTKS